MAKWIAVLWSCGLAIFDGQAGAASASPAQTAPVQMTQTAFDGSVAEEPAPWSGKPAEAIDVWFCTRGPLPPKGSLVTLVPGSSDLQLVTVRVVGPRKPSKGCKGVVIELVKQPDWVRWDWSKGGWWNNRVMVLLGEQRKARAIPAEAIDVAMLPTGTRREDVRRAVDIDGDNRVDALIRYACEDGGHSCEEFGCQEMWIRQNDKWRQYDKHCGD